MRRSPLLLGLTALASCFSPDPGSPAETDFGTTVSSAAGTSTAPTTLTDATSPTGSTNPTTDATNPTDDGSTTQESTDDSSTSQDSDTRADSSTGEGPQQACGNGAAEPGDDCFGDFSVLSVGCPPTHLQSGDLDENGALDIVYAAASDGEVHVFLGNGEGDFAGGSFDALNFGVRTIALGRFNNDDAPDLGYLSGAAILTVLLNDGNGTVDNSGTEVTEVGGNEMATGDLNGDGYDDILVVGTGATGVNTALMNPDGSGTVIETLQITGVGTGIREAALITELNGNANADLVFGDITNSRITTCLGNGAGGAATCTNHDTGTWPVDVAAGDIDGDGNQDIVTADSIGNTLTWLPGQGNGGFEAAVSIAGANGVSDLVVADFNIDGFDDIAYIAPQAAELHVRLYDPEAGEVAPPTIYTHGSGTFSDVIAADFNEDGLPDLAVGNEDEATIALLLSDA